jgi:hypothetical protein
VVQIAFERRVRRIGNKVDDPIPNNFGGILFAVDGKEIAVLQTPHVVEVVDIALEENVDVTAFSFHSAV